MEINYSKVYFKYLRQIMGQESHNDDDFINVDLIFFMGLVGGDFQYCDSFNSQNKTN